MKHALLFCILLVAGTPALLAQQPTALAPGFSSEQFLGKNQKEAYTVSLAKGDHFSMVVMQQGVDVVIDLFGPDGKKIKSFDSPNGATGPEPVTAEALAKGTYRFEIHPFDDRAGLSAAEFAEMTEKNQGRVAIGSVTILSAKAYQAQEERRKLQQDSIIGWLAEHTIPLAKVTAGGDYSDLMPLKKVLDGVEYVGLGEATHGTREFFQFKHRMLEFLVKEMGFTVFAIEASFAGCKNINDYVMYGKGDAHTALASQGFWTWDTEEVIEMIEWMRTYNQSVAEEKRVRFTGFDIQVNTQGGGIGHITDYLQKVDTLRFREARVLLDSIEFITDTAKQAAALRDYNRLLSFFVASRGLWVQRSSAAEYETALDYCRALGQLLDAYYMKDSDPRKKEREWRDYYMAGNFFDFVAHEKPGTKVMLWAHNGHVSPNAAGMVNGGVQPFGSYLRAAYGKKYYAFGFLFNQGGFQSVEVDSTRKSLGLQEFTVQPAKPGSLDWFFAQAKKPMCILDMRQQPMPALIRDFLGRSLETRSFGSMAYREYVGKMYGSITPATDFDGLIFIDKTERSRPTGTGMRKGVK